MTERDYIKVGARAKAKELLSEIHKNIQEMDALGFLPEPHDVLQLKHSVEELLHAIDTFKMS